MDRLSEDRLTNLKQSFSRLERHVTQMQKRRQRNEDPDVDQTRHSIRRRAQTARAKAAEGKESKIPVPTSLSTSSSLDGAPFDPGPQPRRSVSSGPTRQDCHKEIPRELRQSYDHGTHTEAEECEDQASGAVRQSPDPDTFNPGIQNPGTSNPGTSNRRKLVRETCSTFRKLTADVNGEGHGQGQSRRIWFKSNQIKTRRPLSVEYSEINVALGQAQQRPKTVHEDVFVKSANVKSDGLLDKLEHSDSLYVDSWTTSNNPGNYSANPSTGRNDYSVSYSLQTDGTARLTPQTEGSSKHTPQTDGSSRHTPRTDGSSRHTPRTDGSSRLTPQANGSSRLTPQTDGPSRYTPQTDGPTRYTPRARRSLPNVPVWGNVEGRKHQLSLQALQKLQTGQDSNVHVNCHRSLDIGLNGETIRAKRSPDGTTNHSIDLGSVNSFGYHHSSVLTGAKYHNGSDEGTGLLNHDEAIPQALPVIHVHASLPVSPVPNPEVHFDRDLNLSDESVADIYLDEHSAEMESILASKSAESSHDTGFTSPSKDLSTWSVQTQMVINQTRNEVTEVNEANEQESTKEHEPKGIKSKTNQAAKSKSPEPSKGVPKSSETLKRIIDELKKEAGQKKEEHSKVKQWREKFSNKTQSLNNVNNKTESHSQNHPSLQQLLQCCDLMTIRFYKDNEDSLNFKLVDCEFTESAVLDSTVAGSCRPPNGTKTIRLGGGGAFIPIAPAKPTLPPQYVIAVEHAKTGSGELKDGDCILEVNRTSVVDDNAESVMKDLAQMTGWIYMVVARRQCRIVGNPYELSKEVEKLRVKYETLKLDAEKNHDVIADLRLDLQDREDHLEALQKNTVFTESRLAVAEELREKQERLATHWRQQWQQKVVEMEKLKEQLHQAQHGHVMKPALHNGDVMSSHHDTSLNSVPKPREPSATRETSDRRLKLNDEGITVSKRTRVNHSETYSNGSKESVETFSKTKHKYTSNGISDTNSRRHAARLRLSHDLTSDKSMEGKRSNSSESVRHSLDNGLHVGHKAGSHPNRRDHIEDSIKLKCSKTAGISTSRSISNDELNKMIIRDHTSSNALQGQKSRHNDPVLETSKNGVHNAPVAD